MTNWAGRLAQVMGSDNRTDILTTEAPARAGEMGSPLGEGQRVLLEGALRVLQPCSVCRLWYKCQANECSECLRGLGAGADLGSGFHVADRNITWRFGPRTTSRPIQGALQTEKWWCPPFTPGAQGFFWQHTSLTPPYNLYDTSGELPCDTSPTFGRKVP